MNNQHVNIETQEKHYRCLVILQNQPTVARVVLLQYFSVERHCDHDYEHLNLS